MNRQLLAQFQQAAAQIDFLIDGLNLSFLQTRHQQDKWSIQEHIAHLGRYQEIFQQRYKKVLLLPEPVLKQYRSEGDPAFDHWKQLPMDALLERLHLSRALMYKELSQLPDSAFQKTGKHPKLGNLSLEEWIHFFLLHEQHHFYSIFRMKMQYR